PAPAAPGPGGAAPPAVGRARPGPRGAGGDPPAGRPPAPWAARPAGTAPPRRPDMPRTPRGGGEPTSSLLPLAGPAGLPSCNASSSPSFSIKHLPQARMRPRQLRLGKAHGLAHLLRDLLVRVALHVVQPHHRARRLAQLLEGALQIDPRGHPAHGTVAAR